MDLRRILFWLAANFLANAVLVFGVFRLIDGQASAANVAIVTVGALLSVSCMLVLARPRSLGASRLTAERDEPPGR